MPTRTRILVLFVVRHTRNQGVSSATNAGPSPAKGEVQRFATEEVLNVEAPQRRRAVRVSKRSCAERGSALLPIDATHSDVHSLPMSFSKNRVGLLLRRIAQ